MNYVEIQTELVVVGTNPEIADFENPRGEIYGVQARIMVETKRGERILHCATFDGSTDEDAMGKAEPLRKKIEEFLKTGGKLNRTYWHDVQPRYGSEAYCTGGWEQKTIFAERQAG